MKTLSFAFLLACLAPVALKAQVYCSPTFASGCFSWRTISIDVGSISYVEGSDCTVSDFTALSTTVAAGDVVPMEVVSGVWCGAAVWVDFDQDLDLDTLENLFYQYTGGATDYTYSFNITIPASTPVGSYRMRVISPWGSDGYSSTNMNGYGACGNFEYGNFIDLTLNVVLSTGIQDNEVSTFLNAYPNPTTDAIIFELDNPEEVQSIVIYGLDGRVVQHQEVNASLSRLEMDVSSLANGVYVVQCSTNSGTRSMQLVKE